MQWPKRPGSVICSERESWAILFLKEVKMQEKKIWEEYPMVLNIEQVSELLKVSHNDAWELLSRNKIKNAQLGQYIFFVRQEYLLEYLLEKENK